MASGSTRSFTPLIALHLVGAVLTGVFGYAFGMRSAYLATGALLGLAVSALLGSRRLPLDVVAAAIPRCTAGEPVAHRLQLTNTGVRPSPPALVEVANPGFVGVAGAVCPALWPGESTTLDVYQLSERRGVHGPTRVCLSAPDPLDQRRYAQWAGDDQPTIVHPRRVWPLPVRHWTPGGDDDLGTRFGTDVAGVRQWAHGDSARAVHWRASARHRRLIVVERRDPQRESLQIVIAGDRFDDDGEAQLATAASTAVDALAYGARVSVVFASGRRLEAGPARAPLAVAVLPAATAVAGLLPEPGGGALHVLGVDVPTDWSRSLAAAVPVIAGRPRDH
jgi:uncharacterized protein (DUF58 family)